MAHRGRKSKGWNMDGYRDLSNNRRVRRSAGTGVYGSQGARLHQHEGSAGYLQNHIGPVYVYAAEPETIYYSDSYLIPNEYYGIPDSRVASAYGSTVRDSESLLVGYFPRKGVQHEGKVRVVRSRGGINKDALLTEAKRIIVDFLKGKVDKLAGSWLLKEREGMEFLFALKENTLETRTEVKRILRLLEDIPAYSEASIKFQFISEDEIANIKPNMAEVFPIS